MSNLKPEITRRDFFNLAKDRFSQVVLLLLLSGCGSKPPAPEPTSAPPDPEKTDPSCRAETFKSNVLDLVDQLDKTEITPYPQKQVRVERVAQVGDYSNPLRFLIRIDQDSQDLEVVASPLLENYSMLENTPFEAQLVTIDHQQWLFPVADLNVYRRFRDEIDQLFVTNPEQAYKNERRFLKSIAHPEAVSTVLIPQQNVTKKDLLAETLLMPSSNAVIDLDYFGYALDQTIPETDFEEVKQLALALMRRGVNFHAQRSWDRIIITPISSTDNEGTSDQPDCTPSYDRVTFSYYFFEREDGLLHLEWFEIGINSISSSID